MDAARWKQVQDLFHQAVSLADGERDALLHHACDGDSGLQKLLERLLLEDRNLSAAWDDKVAGIAKGTGQLADPLAPAEDVGPYRFVRPLGQGGMGAVFQAEHRITGQVVAIKVLRTAALSVAGRERFATEQRALARLTHPLIARLYGSEKFRDGTPCFVMEYVEGEPLTTYCRNQGSSLRERMLLLRQVCEAVQHAHEHAIIHRDLKPSNILVKSDGTVRLLDFGIAKQLDTDGDQVSITGLQAAPMTLGYAAPEQVAGGSVGTHTDVYSLGVILYELLTGRVPLDLDGLTPGEAETAIRFQNPERPSSSVRGDRKSQSFSHFRFGRTNWSDLDVLCGTAIHKDPARRYRSVEALIRDLDHWLRSEPLDAREDSIAYRIARFVERNQRPVMITVLTGAFFTAATVWFTVNLAKARDEALAQQTKTQRVERFVLSLFDNGDPVAGPGKSATALTMLDRGRKEAETLQNDREFQTELDGVLGGLYQKLGRFDQADELLQAVLANRKADQTGGGKGTAESLIALGLLRNDESRFPEAEALVRQGLKLMQQEAGATQQNIAAAESELGSVLVSREHFKDALPLLQDALRIQTRPGASDSDRADTLSRLAGAQQEAGDYSAAATFNDRALSINRHLYGAFHPRIADDWQSLGAIRQMQGRFADAVTDYGQALHIYQGWYGTDHPKAVESLICLGQALLSEGQYDSARKTLSEGVALGSRNLGEKDQVMVLALNALGTLEQRTGHFDAARSNFERMIYSARVVYGASSYIVAVGISNLATVERITGHSQHAEKLYREALDNCRKLLPPDHPDLGKMQLNLGKVLWNEHRYGEAEQSLEAGIAVLSKLPDQPLKDLEQARTLLQDIRRSRKE